MKYKHSKTISENLTISGTYDAQNHTISSDEGEWDVLDALSNFDQEDIKLSAILKHEEELD